MVRVDDNEFGKQYFRQIIGQIEDHEDWEPKEETSIEEMTERLEAGNTAEIDFVHSDTEYVFRTQLPGYGFESALTGSLRASILPDPHHNAMPEDDSFQFRLAEAYQRIAESHTTEYSSPATKLEDGLSFDLLSVNLPWEHQQDTFEETLDELSTAGYETDKLNQSIRTPVEEYLE
jgi:hypothetical protein